MKSRTINKRKVNGNVQIICLSAMRYADGNANSDEYSGLGAVKGVVSRV